jgi:hypothetical protein
MARPMAMSTVTEPSAGSRRTTSPAGAAVVP